MDDKIVFDVIVKKLKEKENFVSLMLLGKTATKIDGDINDLNDIDILAVYDDDESFVREVRPKYGVDFDISYMNVKMLENLVEDKNELWIQILAKAHSFENKEFADGIIKKAAKLFEEGPDPLSEDEIHYIRFEMYRKLNRLKSNIVTNPEFEISGGFTVKYILESYYRINKIWVPKEKNILKEIRLIDSEINQLLTEYKNKESNFDKYYVIKEIAEYTTKNIGGLLEKWDYKEYPVLK
jgi:hypothetical protein